MAINTNLHRIKNLIANGNVEQALKQLLLLADDDAIKQSEVTAIMARFNGLKRQIRIGVITAETATLMQNQIIAATLDTISNWSAVSEDSMPSNQDKVLENLARPPKSSRFPWLQILILLLGIVIGFLGELMPDEFKAGIQYRASNALGLSFLQIWIILTVLVIGLLIWLTWKLEKGHGIFSKNTGTGNHRTVVQKGKASNYFENNSGQININNQ